MPDSDSRPESPRHKVALVTGANHGIGAATAKALAAEGIAVVVTYLRVEDPPDPDTPEAYRAARRSDAGAIVAEIEESGGRAVAIEADLADPETPRNLFDFAESQFGPVQILINNATAWRADTFAAKSLDRLGRNVARMTAASVDEQFSVDARGAALLIAELAARYAERGAGWGRIVGLTSGGRLGFSEEVSYGAAKAALENYAMSAAFELAPLGITSNVVYPPVTDTGWVTDTVRTSVESHPTLLHVVPPGDVADVIAYLCSDAAWLITGNVIHLC